MDNYPVTSMYGANTHRVRIYEEDKDSDNQTTNVGSPDTDIQDAQQNLNATCAMLKGRFSNGYLVCASAFNIALLIIGTLSLTGHITPAVLGGCTIGFVSASFILTLIGNKKAKGKSIDREAIFGLVLSVALVILGALTITGHVSPKVMSWCLVGPTAGGLALLCCCGTCALCCGGIAAAVASQGEGPKSNRKNTVKYSPIVLNQ